MAWVIFPAASLLLVSVISETAARFEAWLIGVGFMADRRPLAVVGWTDCQLWRCGRAG